MGRDAADHATTPARNDRSDDGTSWLTRAHDGGDEDDRPDDDARPRRGRRVLLVLGILSLVLLMTVAGSALFLVNRYSVDEVGDVFAGIEEESRPAPAAPEMATGEPPVTFLLVGSDTRADIAAGETPDARSDAIMIARLAGNRQNAQIISIPRDSWVDVPGYGMNKINAAYAFGGPTLLIQTVEQLTDIRIDHYAAISFAGLISMTDDLGGVDVQVAETTTTGPYTFQAGQNHLDGEQARYYVGQRYDLPGGDFDRVRRQQNYLRSMFGKLFTQGTFTSPGQIDSVLQTITGSIAVDESLGSGGLLSLALSARDTRPEGIDFFTAPVLGTGMEGAASVVYLDTTQGARMWGYLQTDSLGPNADEFADEALPAVPR